MKAPLLEPRLRLIIRVSLNSSISCPKGESRMVSASSRPRAVIIGAGIGGLSAAIALQTAGWDVSVYERTRSLSGIGAGIALAANAMKALRQLGADEQVSRLGAPVRQADIYTSDGRLLVSLPTEEQARRYGAQSYLIHRADLHSVLLGRLESGTVRTDKKLRCWEQNERSVKAVFEDGTITEGDVLIGADGLHSAVRAQLFGESAPLRYAGYSALRGTAHWHDERFPFEQGGGFEAWGPGKRFGVSAIGQGRIFWFAAVNAPQGQELPPAERKAAALHQFCGWMEPIEALISATDEVSILSHDIFDRRPLAGWSWGRVTLLGDAAHPMLPNLGQGGAQAMEDALALARCLRQAYGTPGTPGVAAALRQYEQERFGRTALVVRRSRAMGRMVQLAHPAAIAVRNRLLRLLPARMQIRRLDWLVGYEP